jgi:hypothetical protein
MEGAFARFSLGSPEPSHFVSYSAMLRVAAWYQPVAKSVSLPGYARRGLAVRSTNPKTLHES